MQTIEFLKSVLSDEGYYCTISINLETEETVRKLHSSIEEAYERAKEISENGLNAYFSTATFETDKSSKAANVKHKKAFYLDIDCGPTKAVPNQYGRIEGYIDQATGLAELRKFCKVMSLPKPTLVNSGRGIHAYWALTEVISVDDWLPIAEKLKEACKLNNLIVDPAVPSDAARILRVPGTLNYKDTPPSNVDVLGEFAPSVSLEKFAECFEDITVSGGKYVPNVMDDVTNALAGSYSNSFKLIMQKTAAGKGCAQLGYAYTNRDKISYPLWIAALSVAKFCTDGEKAIHKISSGHPDYDPTITEKRVAPIKGPYRCTTFDEYNPGVCGNCPFKGKFGSPIVLGREVQEASEEDNIVQDRPEINTEIPLQTYVIPQYPAPYFRGKAGGVFKKAKDKEGDPIEVAVYHNDMYITRRLNDPDVGESVVMRLHLPKDGVREFTVPLVNLLSKDEFRKSVAPKGVAVLDMGELMSYTNSWVNKLQATTSADIAHRQFGWTDDRKVAFIVGEKDIRGDRVDINPPSKSTATLFPAFESKGTIEGWRGIMEFYNRPKMELHQYVIGLSFGSPLVAFTPVNASLFHMYSKDTGVGKTTASKAALGIWGNPDQLIMQERDTPNSKMNRLEMLKNVFAVFDELTNIEPKDASDMMYQITGGLQRNRLSGEGNKERFRGAPWHTNAVSTGNTSLLERVSLYKAVPKAEAGRVLEYRVEPHKFDSKAETDDLSVAITQHYGHACMPYMRYVIENLSEVQELFKDTQRRIDIAAGLSQPHRFWSVQAASSITGSIIAKRVGLVNFDIPALVAWVIEMLITAKGEIEQMSGTVEDLLASFLSENYNNVLRIRSTDDARGSNADALEHLIVPDATPRMTLVARYEYDVKKMYILPKPLKQWCVRNQHNYSALVNGLKEGKTKAVSKKIRMGKGTNMNLPSADVWVLDCTEFSDDELPVINVADPT
jgi:hypothetical protein